MNEKEIPYLSHEDPGYLAVESDDKYSDIALKTLLAFEEIYDKYDFDFVFRTNTSSYLNFEKFQKYVSANSNDLDYSGVQLHTKSGDNIASGAGFFISKQNIEILLNNKKQFDTKLADDVAVARCLAKNNIFPTSLPREDLKNVPSVHKVTNSNIFHYRCRLDPQFPRILEPLLFKYLSYVSTNNRSVFNYLYYLYAVIIFQISNLKFIRKIIQKFYSYKFYGLFQIGEKIIYSKLANL